MKNQEKGHTAVVGLGGSCSLLVQESLLSFVARSICVKGSTGKKQRWPFGVLEVLETQIILSVVWSELVNKAQLDLVIKLFSFYIIFFIGHVPICSLVLYYLEYIFGIWI